MRDSLKTINTMDTVRRESLFIVYYGFIFSVIRYHYFLLKASSS